MSLMGTFAGPGSAGAVRPTSGPESRAGARPGSRRLLTPARPGAFARAIQTQTAAKVLLSSEKCPLEIGGIRKFVAVSAERP